MDEQEQELFDRFEKDTNHRFLLKLTERAAKTSWLFIIVALILVAAKFRGIGNPLLAASLVLLFISLSIGIYGERIRRKIQKRVEQEMER